jgi:AmiR/NasT family two-component response regulator
VSARVEDREERIRQLENALESRVVIEQAKGRLAERFELDLEDAFALLRTSARSARMPLRALAQEVVEHPGSTPANIVATLARPVGGHHPGTPEAGHHRPTI